MSNETRENDNINSNKKHAGCLVWLVVLLVAVIIPVIIGVVISNNDKNDDNETNNRPSILQADMSDISGNWTQGLLQNTYTFIPSCNINGLVLRFRIYNSDYKLQNTIDKRIGDVRKGQQYTVTITIDEYWTGSQVETSVLEGTKTIF